LDEIKDKVLDTVQLKIMDLFISKGAHLTLGLLIKSTGNDSLLINKVSERYKKGLFELALDGNTRTTPP
jgi:hypothetical protein